MNPGVSIIVAGALAVFFGYQLYKALKTGVIEYGSGSSFRAHKKHKEPGNFWFGIFLVAFLFGACVYGVFRQAGLLLA